MAQRIAVTPRAGTLSPKHAKNYDAGVPASLEYPRVALHALLEQAAELYPGSAATIFFNAKKPNAAPPPDTNRSSPRLRPPAAKPAHPAPRDPPNSPQSLS